MPTVQVINASGKKVKEIKAPDEVYAVPVKEHLIYEAVLSYRANKRQGTASTKTRGEARGGGRKPWRQKGTGRSRAGSIRSPIWKGGGTTFGPKPRDYSYSLPRKAKKNALKSALSMKLAENLLVIVEALELEEPKTKAAAALIKALNLDSALIVDSHENKNLFLSMRNLPKIKTVDSTQVTIYDVLNYKWLVLTKKAYDMLTEKLK
ncbi:MAG: 50S ribosomal protein L4 [Candidatus Aminicenantes bacterium]|jgi:large subunit ribosomal protein L4